MKVIEYGTTKSGSVVHIVPWGGDDSLCGKSGITKRESGWIGSTEPSEKARMQIDRSVLSACGKCHAALPDLHHALSMAVCRFVDEAAGRKVGA